MTAIILNQENLALVKKALIPYLDFKSSHVSEALAAAVGQRTHASLIAYLNDLGDADDVINIDEGAFADRLKTLDPTHKSSFPIKGIFNFLCEIRTPALISTKGRDKREIKFTSQRSKAWRNLMVAAINAGIEQNLFSTRMDDNRWPGSEADYQNRPGHLYFFEFQGMRAVGYVFDINFGELSIHAAVNPRPGEEDWVKYPNAGFNAGDAFASGWLERKRGPYLQTSEHFLKVRKGLLPVLAGADLKPKGYGDRGVVR